MPTPHTDQFEEIVKEYWEKYGELAQHPLANGLKNWIVSKLHHIRRETEKGMMEKAIKLSDEIEAREPDGSTEQWMAFKAFRNTMRDWLTKLESDNSTQK